MRELPTDDTPPMSRTVDVTFKSLLGHGSYGRVYECTLEGNETPMAAKVIPIKNYGQPDLLEASIMTIYDHPSLAKAHLIHAGESRMFIIQKKATLDMARLCRKQVPSELMLHSWCLGLVQAVACLHNERIIHCDIKGANVLHFPDNRIALTDFTLATLADRDTDFFKHMICTVTHRPPEVIAGQFWSFSVDIWSLGCTFYEMATGELLIPYQGKKVPSGLPSMDRKRKINEKTLAAITLWSQRRGQKSALSAVVADRDVEQVSPSERFLSLPADFQSLVMWMLSYDPSERPTVFQILNHPYFGGVPMAPYIINSTPVGTVSPAEVVQIERNAARYQLEANVVAKAKEIYSRCTHMREAGSLPLALACMWIASKLIRGVPIVDVELPLHQMVELERLICKHLNYRLHVASRNVVKIVEKTAKRAPVRGPSYGMVTLRG